MTKAGRPEEALAAARIAVEKRPDHADAYATLGGLLVDTERFIEAEEILDLGLEIDPSHKENRHNIAEMLRVQSRYQEALEAYRAVIEIDPEHARSHAYMGDVLVRLHRYADAVESLNKALTLIESALSLRPNLPTAGLLHALLGKAWWGLGRLQAGDEHFRRALELDPHNRVTIEYVAVAHFRRKRYRQALDLFRTQLEIDPARAATHAHMGATLFYLGRAEEAIRSLKRALALDTALETARSNLEEMRKRVRKLEE